MADYRTFSVGFIDGEVKPAAPATEKDRET